MKYCLYCTCMGTLASSLKEEALRSALGPAVALKAVDRLCDNAACRKALEGMAFGPADTVVAAACSKGSRGAQALACLRSAAPGVRAELADIREACVWPGSKDSAGVAAQAADLVRMGFARLESAVSAEAEAIVIVAHYRTQVGRTHIFGSQAQFENLLFNNLLTKSGQIIVYK